MGLGESDAIEFRVLGTFEVASNGRVLEIGSPKQRALLAMLVLQLNRVISLDSLVDELWGERPLASANSSVQSLVSRLRRSLSEASPEGGKCLRGREPGYVLEADLAQVDSHRFEDLAERGRTALARGDAATAAEALEQALGLWRGPALADLADRRFARLEASRLEEARLGAIEELVEAELALGHPERALGRLETHVADHPLRERAWGQLMVALYRLGRQADALRAYQEVRRILRDELGLEPTPWLRRLEEQVLNQRPELEGLRPPEAPGRLTEAEPAPTARPDGTVVLLFTDIEASTRRWEGDRESMAQDLSRHDELLRRAVEEARGRVFAHTGDGLCATFPTAQAALAAALTSQCALLSEGWVSSTPVRVRMAIHAGAAEPRGDNYVGPTLNRADRLLSLGHGGQVLCSQVAADLLRDHLPPDISLMPLGEQHLADLSRPERVFQVCHPKLPASFPPLRSPRPRRHNLPVALTSFVGRAQELEDVRLLLRSSRLVTLTGVGGVGKTRLALEAVGGVLEEFTDGVWIVELSPLRDPALVAPTLMTVLGLLTTGVVPTPDALADRLGEHLEERQALLVFDNCEHLVEATAELVHRLLSRCPTVSVLVTSRELLGLPGETAWRVPPLSLPTGEARRLDDLAGSDAVSLFCERARTALPGFDLSSANAVPVGQICRRLDGIPLALELAAARIRVLGAHQVAERLDDRFGLLTGGARTAVPRHQTLRATVDWSYDLLPPAEQTVLRRLAVFPGSFDLEAAVAVVGSDDGPAPGWGVEVLDLLSQLVDKSLIGVEGHTIEVRYRLLGTVREYAGEKLARAGETEATRGRHRDFFLAMAEQRASNLFHDLHTQSADFLGWADANHDSFRTALEWSMHREDDEAALRLAICLSGYWFFTTPKEGADWFERVLDRPALAVSPQRVDGLIGLAWLLHQSGSADADRTDELLQEARQLALATGNSLQACRADYFRGELAVIRGDPAAAAPLLAAALATFDPRYPVGAAWCHHNLGWLALSAGDRREAQTHFSRSLELASGEAPTDVVRVHALGAAAVLAAASDAEQAESLAEEAVTAARRLPSRTILVMALARATETAFLLGRPRRDRLAELLGLLHELGRSPWVAEALEMAALVEESDRRTDAAARLLGTSRALREASGQSPDANRSLLNELKACRERLARELGPEALAERDALGRAMPVREALAYALGELDL